MSWDPVPDAGAGSGWKALGGGGDEFSGGNAQLADEFAGGNAELSGEGGGRGPMACFNCGQEG